MRPESHLASRRLEPEWLDELAPSDPRARRSRAELRRVNAFMLQAGLLARLLGRASAGPARLLDLGAGDGHFLLRVARRLGPAWAGSEAVLVDRQASVDPAVLDGLRALGWTARVEITEILALAGRLQQGDADVICANLVLHHFEEEGLAILFSRLARAGIALAAVEPRRSALAAAGCKLLPLIGCGQVTLHDAAVSVRAGFAGRELTALWQSAAGAAGWRLAEEPAGLFSHSFLALPGIAP